MPTTRRSVARAPLTRERILLAARTLADEDGLEALTMRRLADDLGVEAMSIYHHLPNKDAILDGLVELAFGEIEDEIGGFGVDDAIPWREALRARILGARRVMLRHRWVPVVLENRGQLGPTMARYIDGVVAVMRSGGLSHDLIHHALHALGSRMYGFTQELTLDDDAAPGADDLAAMRAFVPHLAEMLENVVHEADDTTLGWCDDQTEFEFGLDILLEGLERRHDTEVAR